MLLESVQAWVVPSLLPNSRSSLNNSTRKSSKASQSSNSTSTRSSDRLQSSFWSKEVNQVKDLIYLKRACMARIYNIRISDKIRQTAELQIQITVLLLQMNNKVTLPAKMVGKTGFLNNFSNNRSRIIKGIEALTLETQETKATMELTSSPNLSINFKLARHISSSSSLMLRFRHSCNFRNYIRCRNWTKWHKCNSSGSKQSSCSAKIWLSNNNGKFSSNLATTRLRYKCRISNIRWCWAKACTATTCNFWRPSTPLTLRLLSLTSPSQDFQAVVSI